MSPRLFALLVPFILLVGCSTPESEDLFDTILCWLRPSCLPSQPPQSKAPAKPAATKPSPVIHEQEQVQKKSPNNDLEPCLTSTETASSASESIKRVSYIEPTTQADGKTLTDLKKTSIYFHPGNDPTERKLIMECAATTLQGGGMIPEGGGMIQININEKIGPDSKICVNATDTVGNVGSSICEPIK